VLAEQEAERPAPVEGGSTAPAHESVNPEEVRRVLENPRVAQVVDVFKGHIVAIKKDGAEASS
jgi:hypothetical protein